MPGRRQVLALLLAAGAFATASGPAVARQGWAGSYRVSQGPDTAGELVLGSDGRFTYVLAEGALDEVAQGSWREEGGIVRLTTEPKPRPPVFSPAMRNAPVNGPLRVSVTWPDGRGIAGIDFRIGFAVGEPVTGYTQEDGWTESGETIPDPRWIELAEPIHGIASPRFAIAPGQRLLAFVLTPNDLGVVDFTGAAFRPDGDRFILAHPRGGELRFVQEGRD